ncbi:LuxR family transcriptional regulator [Streptomyces sp. NBC_00335]|uniref:helix-turn-helix transcriptional regulator n=1 Tax=unclassified Streptomyces TaxID=2593676 RepID=UPI002256A134|nr:MULTISPECIES: LuxR family transcriptional regulator [unclassified Streptomyces]MCX5409607.1 LuxR family transcriptional regulator [Streptomyces sp. NBC_00086]
MTGHTTAATPCRIYGRTTELAAVAALSDQLRPRHGGALLLAAEPGLGRSALLTWAADAFTLGPVLRPRRLPGEPRPYDGMHALLCAAAESRGAAPPRAAFGTVRPAGLPELLRQYVPEEHPLLVCVDDVHLWDAPSRAVLGSAARRPDPARPIGLLLSVAEHRADDPEFAGLPVVRFGPLDDGAATALLRDLTGGGLDPAVRSELLSEAEGNPAVLTALAQRLTPDQLGGHRPLPRPLVDGGALWAVFGSRLAPLPSPARQLLLLVAAAQEPDPDAAGADASLVLLAARKAGLDPAALDPAEAARLVHHDGDRIAFAGSLLRRTVYSGAPSSQRRAAHALLASVIDSDRHRLHHLLHLALAAQGPDAVLAAGLVEAAAPGTPTSGMERSAALARAAELTAHEDARTARLTAAADYARLAGHARRARRLLAATREGASPDALQGRTELVRGSMALRDGPVGDAYQALIMAAERLDPSDAEAALEARMEAMDAAWAAGDAAACLAALAEAPLPAPPRDPAFACSPAAPADPFAPGRGVDPMLDYRAGLRTAIVGHLAEARSPLRRVLDRARDDDDPTRLLRAGVAALVLGDIAAACRANARALAVSRSRGLASLTPRILEHLAYAELRAGQHARARAHAQEGLRAAHRAGQRNVAAGQHAILALVASVEDDAAAVAAHAGAAVEIARPHGLLQAVTLAEWASARADLCRGRPFEAAARLGPLTRPGPGCGHFAVRMLALPCFVEAAVQSGASAEAKAAVEEFALWAALGTDPQAPAQLARCRALIAPPDDTADALYALALTQHETVHGDFERARTQLLYGKWLRRRRRPAEAKNRLRDALVTFERCGAPAWAEQTRAELRATGDAPAPAPAGGLALLTPQQLRIARCVAEGATNREVALTLSVSPRTVDHHLRNVFAVLGVRSRTELSRLVDRAERGGAPAQG